MYACSTQACQSNPPRLLPVCLANTPLALATYISVVPPFVRLRAQYLGSVASGALACFASVLGKVAFDGDTPFQVMATTSCEERFPGLALCNTVRGEVAIRNERRFNVKHAKSKLLTLVCCLQNRHLFLFCGLYFEVTWCALFSCVCTYLLWLCSTATHRSVAGEPHTYHTINRSPQLQGEVKAHVLYTRYGVFPVTHHLQQYRARISCGHKVTNPHMAFVKSMSRRIISLRWL